MLRLALVATLATGCMNLAFNSVVNKPQPGAHDSPLSVVMIGGTGDLLISTGAAAAHATTQDISSYDAFTDTFKDVFLFYALPIFAVDLVIVIIRIKNYKG
jgi:hypothetical protein